MMTTGRCQTIVPETGCLCPNRGATVTRADGFLQWACPDHRAVVAARYSARLIELREQTAVSA